MSGNLIALFVLIALLITAVISLLMSLNLKNKTNKQLEWENIVAESEKDNKAFQLLNFNRQEMIKQESLILKAIFGITFGQGEKVAEKAKIKTKLIILEAKGYNKEYLLELLKECSSIDNVKVNETLAELEKMENYRIEINSLA